MDLPAAEVLESKDYADFEQFMTAVQVRRLCMAGLCLACHVTVSSVLCCGNQVAASQASSCCQPASACHVLLRLPVLRVPSPRRCGTRRGPRCTPPPLTVGCWCVAGRICQFSRAPSTVPARIMPLYPAFVPLVIAVGAVNAAQLGSARGQLGANHLA